MNTLIHILEDRCGYRDAELRRMLLIIWATKYRGTLCQR